MNYCVPENLKIYHIVHVDKLGSIINEGCLWSDAMVQSKGLGGTIIGMSRIKERRMKKNLQNHPSLTVGQCVPFYFCPRSVMLFTISTQSHKDIRYQGGQQPIIHLEADLHRTIHWAEQNNQRWVFTTSNAGAAYSIKDYCSQNDLNKVDWEAVNAPYWRQCREQKQAEFLLEKQFPWPLVEKIGVYSQTQFDQVSATLEAIVHQPAVRIERSWYY
jgi:ssDNA thymidine ADP-ribosyltransferase, DarT